MKTMKTKSVILILLLATIFSCSDDDDNVPIESTTRLVAFSSTINNISTDNDLTYNNNNQLTSCNFSTYNYNQNKQLNNYNNSIDFFYNSQGQITSMIEPSFGNNINISMTYNAQGLIDKMNFSTTSNITERTYNYNGSNRLIQIIETNTQSTNESSRNRFFYDSKGNIIKFTTESRANLTSSYILGRETTYTYDDNKNPVTEAIKTTSSVNDNGLSFTRICSPFVIHDIGNSTTGRLKYYSKNNILSKVDRFVVPNNSDIVITFLYTHSYNADNYPTLSTQNYSDTNGDSSVITSNYTYETN